MSVSAAQILFSLKVQHEYFGETSAAALFQTGKVHTMPELFIHPTANGIIFFVKSPLAHSFSKQIIVPIHYTDPLFINYTKLELLLPGVEGKDASNKLNNKQIYYFSANQADANGVIGADKAPLLPLHQLQFIYPFEKNDLQNLDKIILEPLGSNNNSSELPKILVEKGLLLNMSLVGDGAYTVTFSFTNKPSISYSFFSSDSLFQKPAPAVFQWLPSVQNGKTGMEYTIFYTARQVYWRYFFTGLSSDEWAGFQIQPFAIGGNTIHFEKENRPIQLPNGNSAFVAYTQLPVPFRNISQWKISGVLSPSTDVKLPNAQPDILKTFKLPETSEMVYCAEIFYQF